MLFRVLIPVLLFAAAEQPAARAHPVRGRDPARPASRSRTASAREKLGSLLESTGAGAVWFDYNNDGYLDLYVVQRQASGRRACTHTRCARRRTPRPTTTSIGTIGNGTFTDVTSTAGVGWRSVQHGSHRRRLR